MPPSTRLNQGGTAKIAMATSSLSDEGAFFMGKVFFGHGGHGGDTEFLGGLMMFGNFPYSSRISVTFRHFRVFRVQKTMKE